MERKANEWVTSEENELFAAVRRHENKENNTAFNKLMLSYYFTLFSCICCVDEFSCRWMC